MSTLIVVLVVLSLARLARLITIDEISAPLRQRVVDRKPTGQLAYLVTCPWCVSIWLFPFAAVVAFVVETTDPWLWTALLTFSGSLLAGLAVTVEDRLDR